jgi:hypothetical protein
MVPLFHRCCSCYNMNEIHSILPECFSCQCSRYFVKENYNLLLTYCLMQLAFPSICLGWLSCTWWTSWAFSTISSCLSRTWRSRLLWGTWRGEVDGSVVPSGGVSVVVPSGGVVVLVLSSWATAGVHRSCCHHPCRQPAVAAARWALSHLPPSILAKKLYIFSCWMCRQ